MIHLPTSVWTRGLHQLNLGVTRRGSGLCSCSSVLAPPCLQFALYKKMTQAAILIQSKFRSYYEQKRFQQSRRAAVLIQQHYRSYRRRPGPPHRPTGSLPARSKYGRPQPCMPRSTTLCPLPDQHPTSASPSWAPGGAEPSIRPLRLPRGSGG